MKTKIVQKELFNLLQHLKYYNKLAPFPVYDTEYVENVENKLKEVMENKDKDYDDEPVVACMYCNSLHIEYDELDNDVCMRCGSVNELREFKNIYEYKEYLNGKK